MEREPLRFFRASLNLALCSFHSNYPESFHTFCHRTQGKDLSANCFQMEIKKIITRLLCQNDSCYAAFGVGN